MNLNLDHLTAEIARVAARNPEWQMPALWRVATSNQRTELARVAAENPDWQAPAVERVAAFNLAARA